MGEGAVSTRLVERIQEIPGVSSVSVDLTETGGGINLRLEPDANEAAVMETLRGLLVAYGVRAPHPPQLKVGRASQPPAIGPLGVDVAITPIKNGARVEVVSRNVKSFRIVPASPFAIAQGLSDAWCQVIGRIPVELVGLSLDDDGQLTVAVSDGEHETTGSANVTDGWEQALAGAVGLALGVVDAGSPQPQIAVSS